MIRETIPLSVPNLSLDILENVKETIETGWVSSGGRFITEFEEQITNYVGVDKAVAVQSGTAGLHLALQALGVERDDEVIAPTLTFIAAVNPIKYIGAEPVFMDCDDSLNMDMDKLEEFLENECEFIDGKTINKKTKKHIKAVVVVHVFGNPANMEKLMELKERFNLKILEDSTEALGTYYTSGRYKGKYMGTIGDIGVYSFNGNKIITTGGGGMVVSNNDEYLEKISFWSRQSKTDSLYFIHDEIGYNYRMSNIQAGFGVDQMKRLDSFIETKEKNYNLYKKAIKNIDGLELFEFKEECNPNYWFYSVIVDKEKYGKDRDELLRYLNNNNIQTRPLWGLIHKQKPYLENQSYKIEKALFYEKNLINIPCCSTLSVEEVVKVINKLGCDLYV